MKNIISFILLFFLLSSLLICNGYYNLLSDKPVYNKFFPLDKVLPLKVIDNYISDDLNLKKEAEITIKTLVLKDLDLENWSEYMDYVVVNIYMLDIIDDEEKELLITLSLSQDYGVVGIYKQSGDNFIFNDKIDDITFIKDLSSVKIPQSNRNFIIIKEYLDESTGAYFTDDFIRVFTKVNNKYTEVLRESIKLSGFFYEKWYNPSLENPKWFKLTEESVIDYLIDENNNLVFNISKVISKYEGKRKDDDSIPNDFKLIINKDFYISKYFSDKYNYFIIGEGKIISSNEQVGIIEDYNQTSDSLLNLSHNYYKVINKNGKIDYVRKEDIIFKK